MPRGFLFEAAQVKPEAGLQEEHRSSPRGSLRLARLVVPITSTQPREIDVAGFCFKHRGSSGSGEGEEKLRIFQR
jgi:hypothetical protein